jgi:phosphoglycerate dehydrogenase-like enzyme
MEKKEVNFIIRYSLFDIRYSLSTRAPVIGSRLGASKEKPVVKPKVFCIVPLKRFEEAGVLLPEALDFRFEELLTEKEIVSACQGVDFLLVPAAYPGITSRIIEHIPSVRMIQTAGTGYNRVDIRSAARLEIPVANSPGRNVTTVAEFTIAILIALQRHLVVSDREIKAGQYTRAREHVFKTGSREVSEARIGIIGFGEIGRKVAQLVLSLGASVIYYDVERLPEGHESELGVAFRTLDELLGSCDVISLHLPLTDRTRGMIGFREFGLMQPGALLINTSRGEVVDQKAMAEALESGHLGGAALDTVYPEPLPPDDPLLSLSPSVRDKILLTPHIAGMTRGAMRRMLTGAIGNILRAASGQPPENVVNGIQNLREKAFE